MAILTLWAIIFLALLAAAVASHVSAHLQVASDLKWGVRSRVVGMRGVAVALQVLEKDQTPSFDSLHESWVSSENVFRDVPCDEEGTFSLVSEASDSSTGEAQRRYGLTDEEGKINLNRAPYAVLSGLFRAGGLSAPQADEMALFLIDWRDQNTTREGSPTNLEECQSMAIPQRCKNGDLEALEELWWMPGMTSQLSDAIREGVTLHGSGIVNINTATPLSLRSFGLTENGAESLVRWLSQEGNFFENTGDVYGRLEEVGLTEEDKGKIQSALSSGLIGTRSEFYRGRVEAEFGGRSQWVASFVINRVGEIKWWRE